MIYTVTLNPSLDYFVTVDHLELGKTNRTQSEMILPGGKGINVSIVLKNLGVHNTALGFVAGFVGKEIVRRIEEMGISAELISLKEGNSRINVKVKNIEGTEINGLGPDIPTYKLELLKTMIKGMESGDYLILAGSIPNSVPDSIYKEMMMLVEGKGIFVIVDATGALLRQVLPYRPFLVKPNNDELGALYGVTLTEREEVIPYARRLQEEGAENVLVSMAGKGAVLLTKEGQVLELDAPQGRFVNGVGAGDSMVAGFLAGWLEKKDYQYAFKMGVCAGSASAFSEELATRTEVEGLLQQIKECRKSI